MEVYDVNYGTNYGTNNKLFINSVIYTYAC